jgi:heme exporter protein A
MAFSGHDLTCIRGERVVFQNLSFSVAVGEALILRGPNGSGKSTLLRLAAGFLKPAQGELKWRDARAGAGDDLDDYRDKIHYLGHLDAVKPALSVAENLEFWVAFDGSRSVDADCERALDQLDLSHLADVPGRYLSAGQRRRLNIARVAATAKPLWLLDEPSVSLDDASVARLADLIAGHRAGGGMAMIATHIDLAMEDARTLYLDQAGAA